MPARYHTRVIIGAGQLNAGTVSTHADLVLPNLVPATTITAQLAVIAIFAPGPPVENHSHLEIIIKKKSESFQIQI